MFYSICVIIILILVSSSMAMENYREEHTRSLYFEVEVDAPPETRGVLYVPVTVNEQLRDDLHLTGDGEFSIVQTEHGEALRIVFIGAVVVNGRYESMDDLGNWTPTMLTGERLGNQTAWIGLEREGNITGDVDLFFRLSRSHGSYTTLYYIRTPVEDDWDRYQVRAKLAS